MSAMNLSEKIVRDKQMDSSTDLMMGNSSANLMMGQPNRPNPDDIAVVPNAESSIGTQPQASQKQHMGDSQEFNSEVQVIPQPPPN